MWCVSLRIPKLIPTVSVADYSTVRMLSAQLLRGTDCMNTSRPHLRDLSFQSVRESRTWPAMIKEVTAQNDLCVFQKRLVLIFIWLQNIKIQKDHKSFILSMFTKKSDSHRKLGFLGLIHGDDIIQSNPGIIRSPAHLDRSGPPQWTSEKIKCLAVFLNLLKNSNRHHGSLRTTVSHTAARLRDSLLKSLSVAIGCCTLSIFVQVSDLTSLSLLLPQLSGLWRAYILNFCKELYMLVREI